MYMLFSEVRLVALEMYLIDNKETATPIGTLMSNTHLRPKVAVITPPEIIPATEPKPGVSYSPRLVL
jgi:hypothetical protein